MAAVGFGFADAYAMRKIYKDTFKDQEEKKKMKKMGGDNVIVKKPEETKKKEFTGCFFPRFFRKVHQSTINGQLHSGHAKQG